jgi:uncharacterized protein (TIGR02145 family)
MIEIMTKEIRIRFVSYLIMGLVLMLISCEKDDYDITDIDGNGYHAVTIGTQVWMVENLKTTHYKDGGAISLVTADVTWTDLTSGAYRWYDNDISNKATYGALYNWYTITPGKLCPTGWHVPSDTEWETMEDYLISHGYNYDGSNGYNLIAKSLAASTDWVSTTASGAPGNTDYSSYRNKTGFTALPGGYCGVDGSFPTSGSGIGYYGRWWSSTEYDSNSAWHRYIYYISSTEWRNTAGKRCGFSVRCIKDN